MATRLYVNAAGGVPPVSLAFDAGWDSSANAVRRRLSLTKGAATEVFGGTLSGAANSKAAAAQWYTPPLANNTTISGTYTAVSRARELSSSDNINKRWHVVKVVAPDGTVRGTADTLGSTGSAVELSITNPTGQPHAVNGGLSSISALAGDRIVVEIGFGGSATGTTPEWEVTHGGTGTDHTTTVGDATGAVGWVEFSQDLVFATEAFTGTATLSAATNTDRYPPQLPWDTIATSNVATVSDDVTAAVGDTIIAWGTVDTIGSPDGSDMAFGISNTGPATLTWVVPPGGELSAAAVPGAQEIMHKIWFARVTTAGTYTVTVTGTGSQIHAGCTLKLAAARTASDAGYATVVAHAHGTAVPLSTQVTPTRRMSVLHAKATDWLESTTVTAAAGWTRNTAQSIAAGGYSLGFFSYDTIENDTDPVTFEILTASSNPNINATVVAFPPLENGTKQAADDNTLAVVAAFTSEGTADDPGGGSADLADDAGLTDTATAGLGLARSVDDTAGLTDVAAAALTITAAPADPAGLADAATTTVGAARSVADTTGLTDVALAAATQPRDVADPAGLTDALTVELADMAAAADTLGLTDAAGTALAAARAHGDTAGLTDTVTAAAVRARDLADPAGLTDALTVELAAMAAAADTLGLTDQTAGTVAAARSPGDSVGLTDAVTVQSSGAASGSAADTLGLTDTAAAGVVAARAPSDPAGLTDTVALQRTTALLAAEVFDIFDQLTRTVQAERARADTAGLADAITVFFGEAGAVADLIGLSDTAAAVLATGVPHAARHRVLASTVLGRVVDTTAPGAVRRSV